MATGLEQAAKRTLSALLHALPSRGVGTRVARDTWHPESGKFWEITAVKPKKNGPEEHLEAFGYLHWHGKRTHEAPKRIASVWKYGWYRRDGAGDASAADAPK
mmetsp:Transcript_12326/g.36176  ORF Transcript_12326/g.36176 Transcript_12326/m.36176 type:complete len:103 (-) Transcript_12326:726-1034(-)